MDMNPYRAPQAESPLAKAPRTTRPESPRTTVNWIEVLAITVIIGALVWVLQPPTQSGPRRPQPQTVEVK
jgi:hypothetical protein